jgi:soluble lytic murein transglycosylase-like protein
VSVARRHLVAVAGAVGLGLSVAAQATGSAAGSAAGQDQRPTHVKGASARDARLGVLSKPTKHFNRSVQIAHRKAERSQARSQPASAAATAGGTFPTPESLGVSTATLDSIAACESGGDPTAVSADGTYRGKYQFDYGTWASVGGSGDPATASEPEQDYRAALLYSRGGSSPWPICG